MTPRQWQQLQRAIVTGTVARLVALWSQVDPQRIGPSWDALLPQVLDVVARSQRAAAEQATVYVNDTISRQTDQPGTARPVNPQAFAGVASDGRPLDTLMQLPATYAGRLAGSGRDGAVALGRTMLVDLGSTQVYDAGRLATSVATTTHPQAGGYRRQLRGATNCARCVILAGKWYGWNQGFQRHPRCDCVHVPSVGPKSDYAGVASFDPKAYFESLTEAQQDRTFGKAGAQAIRDGADMNQVVNARRGVRTTTMYGRKVTDTTSGTSTRSAFGKRMKSQGAETVAQGTRNNVRRVRTPRLMPEQIYRDARDREHAIELLEQFGFI